MASQTRIVSDNLDAKIGESVPAAGIFTTLESTEMTVLGAGIKKHRTAVGAVDYNPSALTTDYIITMTDTAAARDVTISTEDVESGSTDNPREFVIKDESMAAGANNITITLENGGTIDGAANVVINANGNSITLYVDGTNAWII